MQEQTLFIEALEIDDAAQRAAFLDRACADDAALRRRVERLLQRHQETGSFLESPAAAPVATVDEPPLGEGGGSRYGPRNC